MSEICKNCPIFNTCPEVNNPDSIKFGKNVDYYSLCIRWTCQDGINSARKRLRQAINNSYFFNYKVDGTLAHAIPFGTKDKLTLSGTFQRIVTEKGLIAIKCSDGKFRTNGQCVNNIK